MAVAAHQQTTSTFIHVGHDVYHVRNFNEATSMDLIHAYLRNQCASKLPNYYKITFYSKELKTMFILNQNELDYGSNPFRLNAGNYDNDMDTSPVLHTVNLYIIESKNKLSAREAQSSIQCDDTQPITFDDLSTEVSNPGTSQQDLPICYDITANENDCFNIHMDPLSVSASCNNEPPIANNRQTTSCSMYSNINNQKQIYGRTNENPCHDSLPASTLSKNNYDCTYLTFTTVDYHYNYPLETKTVSLENETDSEDNFAHLIHGDNIYQTQLESPVKRRRQCDRVEFVLDVKPRQKPIYKSDQYNQKYKDKSNGSIRRVQGLKTDSQKYKPVWPILFIPELYRKNDKYILAVYIVLEILDNQMRVWFKDCDRGFLPKTYTRDTMAVNPIEFNLNAIDGWTREGYFKLNLKMTTLWDKSQKSAEEVHRLTEKSTFELHKADNERSSPRLLCVIKENNNPTSCLWHTMCLSDFIRSTKISKSQSKNLLDGARNRAIASKRKQNV